MITREAAVTIIKSEMFFEIVSSENIFDRKTIKIIKSSTYTKGAFERSFLLGNIDKKIEKQTYKSNASTTYP